MTRSRKEIRRYRLLASAFFAMSVLFSPAHAEHFALGETYTCHFGRFGEIIIDTQEPETTITINGQKHEAAPGAYFYHTIDGSRIEVSVRNDWKVWYYNDIPDPHCIRRKNKRSRQHN